MIRSVPNSTTKAAASVDAVGSRLVVSSLETLRNDRALRPRPWNVGTHLEPPAQLQEHASQTTVSAKKLPDLPLESVNEDLPVLPQQRLEEALGRPEVLPELPFATEPVAMIEALPELPVATEPVAMIEALPELPVDSGQPLPVPVTQPANLPDPPPLMRSAGQTQRLTVAAEDALGQVLAGYSTRRLHNLLKSCEDASTRQLILDLMARRG